MPHIMVVRECGKATLGVQVVFGLVVEGGGGGCTSFI